MTGALPNLYLQWEESTISLDDFLYYVIKRRELGEATWVAVAKLPNRALLFWNDYCIPSHTEYEYIVLAALDVGGIPVEGDESAATVVSGQLNFKSVFLHPVIYPGDFTELPHQSASVQSVMKTALVTPFSRANPTVHIGPDNSLKISVSVNWPYQEGVWARFRNTLKRQRDNGAVLCFRDGRSTRVYCGIVSHSSSRNRPQAEGQAVTLQQVHYDEVVPGVTQVVA